MSETINTEELEGVSPATIDYTVKVPSEMYIDDGILVDKTFQYIGPPKVKIDIPAIGFAYTQKLDGQLGVDETSILLTAADNPLIASLLWGITYDYEVAEEETVDGDVTRVELTNPIIQNYFKLPVYDRENSTFEQPEFLFREHRSVPQIENAARYEMFNSLIENYDFTVEEQVEISEFQTKVEVYNSTVRLPWKFKGVIEEPEAPTIPFKFLKILEFNPA